MQNLSKRYFDAMQESTGSLQIQVNDISIGMPLANVQVTVKNDNGDIVEELITDESGQTPIINLPAPPEEYSLESEQSVKPYATYNIEKTSKGLEVSINSQDLGYLIGYRGETLYAMQSILSAIASKGNQNRIRVILDIEGYKAKREKTLEELAEKVAKTVIRTRKPVKLEPMQAYERKIIHSKLQENPKIETISEGQEPHRRIVISLKK